MLVEFRYAARALKRSWLTAVATSTSLAIGILALSGMAAVIDFTTFRQPRYDRLKGELVAVGAWAMSERVTYPDFRLLATTSTRVSNTAAFASFDYTASDGELIIPVRGLLASSNLLPLIQVHPPLGRLYDSTSDQPGAEPVLLIREGLARRIWGANGDWLKRKLTIGGISYSVIGTIPNDASAPDLSSFDLVLPLSHAPWQGGQQALSSRRFHWLRLVGILPDGVSAGTATQEVTQLIRREREADGFIPKPNDPPLTVPVRSISDARKELAPRLSQTTRWLSLLAAAVLAIATTNAITYLLADLLKARRDHAICQALGSSSGATLRRLAAPIVILLAPAFVASALTLRYCAKPFTTLLLSDQVAALPFDSRTIAITIVVCVACGFVSLLVLRVS